MPKPIPLTGWRPDADPTVLGTIVDCDRMLPTLRGMATAPTGVAPAGVGPLAADARGAAITTDTSGARRVLVGTQTQLYELVGTTWTSRSRPGAYTGAADSRWSFAQFGNAAIATNRTDAMQASTAGAFADIPGAPKARIVVGMANFVLALATTDVGYGDQADRWWCCAYQDHTDWTPNVSTQANTGRLIGDGGAITAGARLGQMCIAYKERAMFVGSYVGSPVVWQWDEVPGAVGCIGPDAVCDIGGAHVFASHDGLWIFDGTRPAPLADGTVRQWWLDHSSAKYRYRTIMQADRQGNRVWCYFPGLASDDGTPDTCMVLHVARREWGRSDMIVQAAMQYVSPGTTIDSAPGTFDDSALSPDSQAWAPDGRSPAVITSARQLVTLTGAADGGSITLGDIGDDWQATFLDRVRLRFLARPPGAGCSAWTRDEAAGQATGTVVAQMTDGGAFDLHQDARWHRLRFDFWGPCEVGSVSLAPQPSGER